MIRFVLNGRAARTQQMPATPPLHVLRGEMALSGPRFGCRQEACGAYYVLVDGRPVASCMLAIDAIEGRAVTTVEGLGTPDAPHPLQQAFLDEQAGQCGYCLSGILVSAAAPLERDPRPTAAERYREPSLFTTADVV